ncbi:hypothetical protein NM688_g1766 [Phlebia brevispora]|uniref:Uncharacterized protein n=1 Tax=Phlebia brevispora TaxID=194682 RepID=A0ACC1TAD7_9APHY|nr:hypothetical protein NM688_g1766 [Phlebia brevispora]
MQSPLRSHPIPGALGCVSIPRAPDAFYQSDACQTRRAHTGHEHGGDIPDVPKTLERLRTPPGELAFGKPIVVFF